MPVPTDLQAFIRVFSEELASCTRKGETGRCIASCVLRYGMYDLQLIRGKLDRDLRILPSSYRRKVQPFLSEWIFGRYHEILSRYRSDGFAGLVEPVSDPLLFRAFCGMLPRGCDVPGDGYAPYPPSQAPWYHLFLYLMAGYAMYVLDEPGHPPGMPFPGGAQVRLCDGVYYCPIRDKEEEIFYSLCNYCPALQDAE